MFQKISNLRELNYQAIVCHDYQTNVTSGRGGVDPDFVVPLAELAEKLRLAVR